MRGPLRHVFELLRNGFPAVATGLVTPFTLTVPQACVVTWVGLMETCAASSWPLALAPAPGKNIARDASAAIPSRPAGRRKRLIVFLVNGARTPRMPT